jgi:hypothetical protein
MSLIRIAARMALIEALRGRTLVGENVLDSEIGSLDIDAQGNLTTDADKPFISVYSDASDGSGALREFYQTGETTFLIEIGVAAAFTERDPETDVAHLVGVGIPDTDANMEFTLDLIGRQVSDALSDPKNEWAMMFKSLVLDIKSITRARTAQSDGARLAAHQIKITASLWADPPKGTEIKPDGPLGAFLALLLQAQPVPPDVQTKVDKIQACLGSAENEFTQELRRYGATDTEAEAMLTAPAVGAAEDQKINGEYQATIEAG